MAHRFTRSVEDTEDVCQESLLKAFTKLDQFAAQKMQAEEFRAWLMKIAANCAIDFLRRKKVARLIPLEEYDGVASESQSAVLSDRSENPEAACTRQERLRMVAEAMAKLPPELRTVCVLRNMMELSTKEVATRLGISSNAVRLRLFRAHRQLRSMLSLRNTRAQKQPRSQ